MSQQDQKTLRVAAAPAKVAEMPKRLSAAVKSIAPPLEVIGSPPKSAVTFLSEMEE